MGRRNGTLTKRMTLAAQLVFADELNDWDIAASVGIQRSTLARWKGLPEFVARVEEHRKAFADAILTQGLASRVERVRRLAEMAERIEGVVQARAADGRYKEPGYTEGIMVRDVKFSPEGDPHDVFSVDTGTSKEYRETLRQIAQEVGQWAEKREVTGAGGRPLAIVEIPTDAERVAEVLQVLHDVGALTDS